MWLISFLKRVTLQILHSRFRMPKPDDAKSTHENVGQLTGQNVRLIAELEDKTNLRVGWGDHLAGAITKFCNSPLFVWLHVIWFLGWILWNTVFHFSRFDPFPFSFLTLAVSLEAIFLSSFILIAENRQTQMAERRSHLDLQINLLTEQENTEMLRLLHLMAEKMGITPGDMDRLTSLKETTNPDQILEQIDAVQSPVKG